MRVGEILHEKIIKLVSEYLSASGNESLDLREIFGDNLPCIEDNIGWRNIEEIWTDENEKYLYGWTMNEEGQEGEEDVYLRVDDMYKIIDWFENTWNK